MRNGNEKDFFLAINPLGVLTNMIHASETSSKAWEKTLRVLGNDDGKARPLTDFNITSPISNTAVIREMHNALACLSPLKLCHY